MPTSVPYCTERGHLLPVEDSLPVLSQDSGMVGGVRIKGKCEWSREEAKTLITNLSLSSVSAGLVSDVTEGDR